MSLIIGSARYVVLPSFIDHQKAIKNDTELLGFRQAYLKDGCAMVRWMAWLDNKYRNSFVVTEWEAAKKLEEFRKQMPLYEGSAYEAISATGPNAGESDRDVWMAWKCADDIFRPALPHYSPTPDTALPIDRETPYLIDSGGQYRDGTCDTTRTSKSSINLSCIVFLLIPSSS